MGKIKHVGKQSIRFENPPYIIGWGNIAGKKEGQGPLGELFDYIEKDAKAGTGNWESAEGELQKKAVKSALHRAKLEKEDIDYVVAGDLQSQITGSMQGLKEFEFPFLGVYGACSTMGESLSIAAMLVDGGFAKHVMAVTSSHTEVAERQFRFPVGYGSQKPQSATWTVTGSGAVLLSNQKKGQGPYIRVIAVTTGVITDYGMVDSMNMGACMAPAAAQVIKAHFKDLQTDIKYYDRVITGDLGTVGRDILTDILLEEGIDLHQKHMDCGMEVYNLLEQDVHCGGSGCGCAAIVLTSLVMKKMLEKNWGRVLFVPTGALLSKISFNEGDTIPGIAHAILLERED